MGKGKTPAVAGVTAGELLRDMVNTGISIGHQLYGRTGVYRPGRISRHDRTAWHVLGDHAARTNDGVFTHSYAAQQGCAGTNRGAALDQRPDAGPIRLRLQLTGAVGSAGVTVIDEGNVVADKNFIFDRDTLANESVTRYFAAIANLDAFLNLNESADLHIVTNLTTIEVCKIINTDAFAELDVRSDSFAGFLRGIHREMKLCRRIT